MPQVSALGPLGFLPKDSEVATISNFVINEFQASARTRDLVNRTLLFEVFLYKKNLHIAKLHYSYANNLLYLFQIRYLMVVTLTVSIFSHLAIHH